MAAHANENLVSLLRLDYSVLEQRTHDIFEGPRAQEEELIGLVEDVNEYIQRLNQVRRDCSHF